MDLDLERIRANAREADTEDLLDRVTVYRQEMEPQAVEIIEEELRQRGLTTGELMAHEKNRQDQMLPRRADGSVVKCSFCHRPAVRHQSAGITPGACFQFSRVNSTTVKNIYPESMRGHEFHPATVPGRVFTAYRAVLATWLLAGSFLSIVRAGPHP